MFDGLFENEDEYEVPDGLVRNTWKKEAQSASTGPNYHNRVGKSFAGLRNQGATCYLNSLVQALYMTPEFRKSIYELDPEELILASFAAAQNAAPKEETAESKSTEGSEATTTTEIAENKNTGLSDADAEALGTLVAMGFAEGPILLAIKRFPHDPDNMRRVDWILSGAAEVEAPAAPTASPSTPTTALPVEDLPDAVEGFGGLFEGITGDESGAGSFPSPASEASAPKASPEPSKPPAATSGPTSPPPKPEEAKKPSEPVKKYRAIPWELQRLFARLQGLQTHATTTEALTTKGFNWKSNDTSIQHDVHELNRVLFDAIEQSLVGTKGEQLINNLYRGSVAHYVKCTKCGRSSDREEYFLDVTLRLMGSNSVEESLRAFVTPEVLDGANQYMCENCQCKVDAVVGVKFNALPRILVLSLARFEYDFERDDRVKNCNKFTFGQTLDMGPFSEAAGVGDGQAIDKLYELFAVVIHRGKNAQWGHYHAYIKDLMREVPRETAETKEPITEAKPDTSASGEEEDTQFGPQQYEGWYDFDDSSVTPIWTSKIAKQFGGAAECAYMLVYRRKDLPAIDSAAGVPQAPAHQKSEVDAENSEIEQATAERLQRIHQMTVHLSQPKSFTLGGISAGPTKRRILQRIAAPTAQNDTKVATPVPLLLDNRITYAELREKIKAALPDAPELDDLQIDVCVPRKDNQVQFGALILSPGASTECLKRTLEANREVKDGVELLIWDGKTINNEEFDREDLTQLLVVRVRVYQEIDKWRENEIVVRDSKMVAADLMEKIKDDTGLHNAFLCRLDLTRVAPLSLISLTTKVFEIFSNDLGSGEVLLSAEEQPFNEDGSPRALKLEDSLAFIHFQQRKSLLPIFVAFDADPTAATKTEPVILPLDVPRELALIQIKERVLAQLGQKNLLPHKVLSSLGNKTLDPKLEMAGGSLAAKVIRLRRSLPGNTPGEVFLDDSLSLKEAGILEYTRIVAEIVAPETSEGTESSISIGVRYVLGKSKKRAEGTPAWYLELRNDLRVNEAIGLMVAHAGLPTVDAETGSAKTYRLYSTDVVWETPTKLFDNVNAKVKHAQPPIESDALLWLEEGPPPVLGAVTLTVAVSTLNTEATNFDADEIFTSIPTFALEISRYETLRSLRRNIYETLLETPNSASLLQDLPVDKQDVEAASKYLRFWVQQATARVLKSENESLKKQRIDDDATILVQLLKEPDPWVVSELTEAAQTTPTLFFLRQRDSATKHFKAAQEWIYPSPNQTEGDPVAALCLSLAQHLNVPVEKLLLAKALPKGRWKRLDTNGPKPSLAAKEAEQPSTSTPAEGTDAAKPSKEIVATEEQSPTPAAREPSTKKGKQNKAPAPPKPKKLWLMDGDVLVWQDTRQEGSDQDYFVSVIQSRTGKRGDHNSGGENTNKRQRSRAPEVPLRIVVQL